MSDVTKQCKSNAVGYTNISKLVYKKIKKEIQENTTIIIEDSRKIK